MRLGRNEAASFAMPDDAGDAPDVTGDDGNAHR